MRARGGNVVIGTPHPHEWAILSLLPPRSVTRVAVLGGAGASERANLLAELLPSVEFLVWGGSDLAHHLHSNVDLHPTESMEEMLETIAGGGEIQAIVDSTGNRDVFQQLFLVLPARGRYILEFAGAGTAAEYVASIVSSRLKGPLLEGDDRSLSRSIASIRLMEDACAIEKAGSHLYKVRDEPANRILAGEAHRHRFTLLNSVPGGSFSSRARLQTNNAALSVKRHQPVIDYPELQLRAYESVDCFPRQVYSMGNLLLPDTFRRIWPSRLTSRAIQDDGRWFAATPGVPATSLPGTYYALDSELPGHFGHFTTEILARVWGWEQARAAFPDIQALISPRSGMTDLAAWQYGLLEAAGIGSADVHVLTAPVTVDRLLGATPMFSNPRYVHPGVTAVWKSIGRALARKCTGKDRLFVSRKPGAGRSCTNAVEVERYFSRRGFALVYPEDHSIGEQVALFDKADVIVGFAGSAMFNLMFAQDPKKVIVIGSQSYDAVNEYLITAAAGGELTYLWCDPQIPMGQKWSVKAFMSDYHFDFRRDGDLLDAVVDAALHDTA